MRYINRHLHLHNRASILAQNTGDATCIWHPALGDPSEFRADDCHKTRMIGLSCCEEIAPFPYNTGRWRTDGQTDFLISRLGIAVLTRDKKHAGRVCVYTVVITLIKIRIFIDFYRAIRVCLGRTMPRQDVCPSTRPSVSHTPLFCQNG